MREVSKQETEQETRIRYMIRLRGRMATFLWTSSAENPLESSIDLRIKTHPNELSSLANNLSCPIEDGEIISSSLDHYNRLLVYASIRPTIKSPEKAGSLTKLVLELNSWDAFYWASRFRELWWEYKSCRRLLRAAKAFRLFFGLN